MSMVDDLAAEYEFPKLWSAHGPRLRLRRALSVFRGPIDLDIKCPLIILSLFVAYTSIDCQPLLERLWS